MAVAGPDLVAKQGEILGRREHTGDQLPHAEEGVLQDQASDIPASLVLSNQLDAHRTTEALPVDDKLVSPRLDPVAQVVDGGLRIDHDATLVGLARRQAVATILKHEDVTPSIVDKHAGDGEAVANVARVPVEHEDGYVGVSPAPGAPYIKSGQLLAIIGRDDEFFIISNIEL